MLHTICWNYHIYSAIENVLYLSILNTKLVSKVLENTKQNIFRSKQLSQPLCHFLTCGMPLVPSNNSPLMKGRGNSLKINCFSHTVKHTLGPLLSGKYAQQVSPHNQKHPQTDRPLCVCGVNMFWSALGRDWRRRRRRTRRKWYFSFGGASCSGT